MFFQDRERMRVKGTVREYASHWVSLWKGWMKVLSSALASLDCVFNVDKGHASPRAWPFTTVRSWGQMGISRFWRTSQKVRISRVEGSEVVVFM